MQSVENSFEFGILIFSWASDMQTLSQSWTAVGAGAPSQPQEHKGNHVALYSVLCG
jgi:hypothetical protein